MQKVGSKKITRLQGNVLELCNEKQAEHEIHNFILNGTTYIIKLCKTESFFFFFLKKEDSRHRKELLQGEGI